MKKYKLLLIGLNGLLVLLFFHYAIYQKERILQQGRLVLLRLAPVDPRSLMQGDYMDLRYDISRTDTSGPVAHKGYFVIQIDSGIIARKVRVQEKPTPLASGEYLIEYRTKSFGRLQTGAESYFFEEGQAHKYEAAAYGGLRIDEMGNSILIGLYDAHKRLIQ